MTSERIAGVTMPLSIAVIAVVPWVNAIAWPCVPDVLEIEATVVWDDAQVTRVVMLANAPLL